jgi:hypothetical protein
MKGMTTMTQEQACTRADAGADSPGPRRLDEVAFTEGRRLAGDPNICAVGYGAKLCGGAPVSGGSVVFFVREKLATRADIEARGSFVVPPVVGGFITDVVAVGRLSAATADRGFPVGNRGTHVSTPLVGGAATMALGTQLPGPAGYGTIGGLCFDSATGTPLLLSNAHVWGQTRNTEVTQPISPAALFGATASAASTGTAGLTVLTRIPTALAAPVAFANSVAQTYLIAGGDADPLLFGQGATAVTPATRTDSEQVTVTAPNAGLAPAGRRLSPTVSWAYQRFASTAVLQASSNDARAQSKLLAARRLFTNAPSYTAGQTVNLYAEIIPAAGGAPATAQAHFVLALLYPLPAGDRVIPRLLRPAPRQTPATVTTQLTGFPAPARVGTASFPFSAQGGAFVVDGDSPGSFQAAAAGALPAGTLALKLPATAVRLFVPPSTQVVLDIDLRGIAGPFVAQGVNAAGDDVGTTTTAAGTAGRSNVTVSASEIVELRLTGAGGALLFAVTSQRGSPETAAPPSYAGAVPVSSLASGHWGASLFVQAIDSGITESANVVEGAIGQARLLADCQFDVA